MKNFSLQTYFFMDEREHIFMNNKYATNFKCEEKKKKKNIVNNKKKRIVFNVATNVERYCFLCSARGRVANLLIIFRRKNTIFFY